jgi:hypothetical protein
MQVDKANGKLDLQTMGKTANDLLSIKRVVETIEAKEVSEDISRFTSTDSFEEVLFLMYETLKKFND